MKRTVFDKLNLSLLIRQPFFASLLLMLERKITDRVPVAATDGRSILINKDAFLKYSKEEQLFILAHEVMHVALCHHVRRGHRDPTKWNIAADFAINLIVKDAGGGLKMPPGCLYDERYRNMSTEEIYDQIEVRYVGGGGEGCPQLPEWGHVQDAPAGTDPHKEQEDQSMRTIRAAQNAQRAGSLPAGIERLVNSLLNSKVDWNVYLQQYLSEIAKNDYTWQKRNLRYSHVYLPALENVEFGEFVSAIDTSGSMTDEMLSEIASEYNVIEDLLRNKVTAIYCDAKVAHVDEFEAGEPVELKMHGGGGTDFRPPFEYLESEGIVPKVFAYFTDGHCSSFPEEPEYPVLWFILKQGRMDFRPPFGTVVFM